MSDCKNLAGAVARVMARVRYIEKTGRNQHFRYDYASDKDVLLAVQPAMAEEGLALIPVGAEATWTEIGKGGNRCYLKRTWRLMHAESGESVEVVGWGVGEDRNDKAVYKAETGALKYALTGLFLTPRGDDPERDIAYEEPEPATEPRRAAEPRPDQATVWPKQQRDGWVAALARRLTEALQAPTPLGSDDAHEFLAWAQNWHGFVPDTLTQTQRIAWLKSDQLAEWADTWATPAVTVEAPRWSDSEKKSFFREVKLILGRDFNYEALCEALSDANQPRPSAMSSEQREGLLDALGLDGGGWHATYQTYKRRAEARKES